VLGLAITVVAFIVIRTTIDAWYSQADAASPNRLVTRHAVSLNFFLPLAYESKIEAVDGVVEVSHASWFGSVYIEPSNFFPQFLIDHSTYFDMYPEFIVPPGQLEAFFTEKNAAIVGVKLADRFGWAPGDRIQMGGTIFPGTWEFVIRGIYTGARENTDENTFYCRWDYVDEELRRTTPTRGGYIGTYIIEIDDPLRAAEISRNIDALFENSASETRTETEEAFSLSFVAMGSSIVLGLQAISVLVIGVVMLVLGNTMAMTARERVSEYAVMKTLGFRPFHITGLVFGESLFMAALGWLAGFGLAVPTAKLISVALSSFFPIFTITVLTMGLAGAAAFTVGILAAVFPTLKAVRTRIVDGLRTID
jgi:putative ABC transport system permease protein